MKIEQLKFYNADTLELINTYSGNFYMDLELQCVCGEDKKYARVYAEEFDDKHQYIKRITVHCSDCHRILAKLDEFDKAVIKIG